MATFHTVFLRIVIVLLGVGALALLLWEPHLEGRNATATVFQVYFNDPFLAYVYAGSIPFFIALCQAFNVLGYVDRDQTFSRATADALRMIKRCAWATAAFVAGATAFIVAAHGDDDAAGAIAVCLVLTFAAIVIATATAVLEWIVRNSFKTQNVSSEKHDPNRSSNNTRSVVL